MATYGAQDIPSSWDDHRDTAFFRITAALFSTDFTYGASVLLASYDDVYEARVAVNTPVDMPLSAVYGSPEISERAAHAQGTGSGTGSRRSAR